ncbi:MAG: hypothetical protein KAH20_12625 [Methylococcales bacterium]|nr:hypothetical protein [Methylococcales bacterium]
MAEIKEFLNPNSMLTPGIAGSIVMMAANTLWINFGFDPKLTALIICLLLGLLVLSELKVPLWQKPIYYVINVLVIFSVSVGTNVVGITTNTMNLNNQKAIVAEEGSVSSVGLSDIGNFFINSAIADDETVKKISSTVNKTNQNNKKIEKKNKAIEAVELDKKSNESKQKNRKFFKSWF